MNASLVEFLDFKKAIEEDELVFVFGTGIFCALSGKSYNWMQWLSDGISYIQNELEATSLAEELKTEHSSEGLVRIAGKVIRAAKRDGTYSAWMDSAFGQENVQNSALAKTLRKLVRTQAVFATTNYDLMLEKATGLGSLSYQEPGRAFVMLDHRLSSHVLHIHGVYDSASETDTIIADENQYAEILNNQGAQFIQEILGTRTLVFIGCGKTMDDANITRLIEFAGKHLMMNRKYYILTERSRWNDELPGNITRIPYGDQFCDLPAFLEDIAQTRLKSLIRNHPIIGKTFYDVPPHLPDGLLKYHYSARAIPFCGRKEELKELLSFVANPRPFTWWAMTGQGGIGKSRVALELLGKLPSVWFGFFVAETFRESDLESFQPFCNMLVVVDYVLGKEKKTGELMIKLRRKFASEGYTLRILLLERENNRRQGSWYSRLLQRMNRPDQQAMKETEYRNESLDLTDLEPSAVVEFISLVCDRKGCRKDPKRDTYLYEMYRDKYESLRFRPLFVQLFVEAYIDNGFILPKYNGFVDVLRDVLEKEQKRWLAIFDGNLKTCDAFVRLLIRANISGSLNVANLPNYYQKDWETIRTFIDNKTFSGVQKTEWQNSIINSVCQNIDKDNTLIAPLFPDLIKEYMFCFYTDKSVLKDVMHEIWVHAAAAFATFIKRCKMDFPQEAFFDEALNAYDRSDLELDVLTGRLDMLIHLKKKTEEDLFVFLDIIENEHIFWNGLVLKNNQSTDFEELSALKVSALSWIAKQILAYSAFDISYAVAIIHEMLEVQGGEAAREMQYFYLNEHIRALSTSSFVEEALTLQKELDSMVQINRARDTDIIDSQTELVNLNNMINNYILARQFDKAFRYYQRLVGLCIFGSAESVRFIAKASRNMIMLFDQIGVKLSLEVFLAVLKIIEMRHPADWIIRSCSISCQMMDIQNNYISGDLTDKFLSDRIKKLKEKLSSMTFNGSESDESLSIAWGFVKTFSANFASKEDLLATIDEANSILSQYPKYAEIATAKIMNVHSLYARFIKKPIPHDEVEEMFRYVEINSDSGELRNAFYSMLDFSEDKDKRLTYFSPTILTHAFYDELYNPAQTSGISEVESFFGAIVDDMVPPEGRIVWRNKLKIGPNDPCPCGSGKKYKKCCGR